MQIILNFKNTLIIAIASIVMSVFFMTALSNFYIKDGGDIASLGKASFCFDVIKNFKDHYNVNHVYSLDQDIQNGLRYSTDFNPGDYNKAILDLIRAQQLGISQCQFTNTEIEKNISMLMQEMIKANRDYEKDIKPSIENVPEYVDITKRLNSKYGFNINQMRQDPEYIKISKYKSPSYWSDYYTKNTYEVVSRHMSDMDDVEMHNQSIIDKNIMTEKIVGKIVIAVFLISSLLFIFVLNYKNYYFIIPFQLASSAMMYRYFSFGLSENGMYSRLGTRELYTLALLIFMDNSVWSFVTIVSIFSIFLFVAIFQIKNNLAKDKTVESSEDNKSLWKVLLSIYVIMNIIQIITLHAAVFYIFYFIIAISTAISINNVIINAPNTYSTKNKTYRNFMACMGVSFLLVILFFVSLLMSVMINFRL